MRERDSDSAFVAAAGCTTVCIVIAVYGCIGAVGAGLIYFLFWCMKSFGVI